MLSWTNVRVRLDNLFGERLHSPLAVPYKGAGRCREDSCPSGMRFDADDR